MENVRVINKPVSRTNEKEKYKDILSNFSVKQFGMVDSNLHRNENYLRENRSMITLYWFLFHRIVRAPMNDGLNIYGKYYEDNVLACSMPISVIAEIFGYGKNKKVISRWIDKLVELGYLRIEDFELDKSRTQNVYILGYHDTRNEFFYIYERFGIGKNNDGDDNSSSQKDYGPSSQKDYRIYKTQ